MKKLRFVYLLQAGGHNFLPHIHSTWEEPFSAALYIFHPILCTSVEVFKYAYVSRAVNQRSGNPAFLPVIYEKCCNYDLDGDVSPARTKALMRLWVTCDTSQ